MQEENELVNEEVLQYDNLENEIKLVFPKRISDIAHDIQVYLTSQRSGKLQIL